MWGRRLVLILSLLTAGAIASACGSGPPGVASVGSTTTTSTTIPPLNATNSAGIPVRLLDYSRCMQHHGVPNFPLPQRNGPNSISIRIGPGTGVNASSSAFQSAQAACREYLPKGAGQAQTITAADQADYLKATDCMRSHGYPDFPDPTISKNNVHFTVPANINQNSTQFKSAVQTCEKLIPAGLPYSGSD